MNVQGGGLSIFRRADYVTRAMSKGGGVCECLYPPSGNPVSAPDQRNVKAQCLYL